MKFKAVIFDLDGTLVNTLFDLADSTNFALEKNGYKKKPRENYCRYAGDGVYKMIERALEPNVVDKDTLKKIRDDFFAHYNNNCTVATEPYENMVDVIYALRENNIRVGCITNKIDAVAKVIVKHYFGDFDFVFGQVDGIPTKPDPYLPNRAFEILGVEPKQVAYVGDSDVDMQTAVNCGMFAIGAAWGFRTKEELLVNGADVIAENPLDILKAISDE